MPVVVGILLLVLALLIGGALLGVALNLLWYLAVGLVVGALGRLIVPGDQQFGVLATALYGVAGALVGGMVADELLGWGWLGSMAASVLAAAVLVALFGGLARRESDRARTRG